jgi:tetratricopeptide (TPR) repeat protein
MHERFQWFLLPAVLLLLLERFMRPVRFRSTLQAEAWQPPVKPSAQPKGFRGQQGVLPATILILALLVPSLASAEDPRTLVGEGNRLFHEGKYAEAAQLYDRAARLAPDSPVPLFNRAASMFELGDYGPAAQLYDQARALAPEGMRQKINYALGNCHLQQAIQSQAETSRSLQEAEAATRFYKDAILPHPQDANETTLAARHNLELAKRLIKHLERQQTQQQQSQSKEPRKSEQDQKSEPQPKGSRETDNEPKPDSEQDSKQAERPEDQPGGEPEKPEPKPGQSNASQQLSPEEAADRLRAAISRAQSARARRVSEQQKPAPGRAIQKDW